MIPEVLTRDNILSAGFLAKYPDFPEEMNALGKFVYYRTYSRWLPNEKRRETWKETCARAVAYNMCLAPEAIRDRKEAETYFDNMFNLREFLSGRTLWVGGTPVADKYPMSNFNCAFTVIESWEDFRDLFYLLMIGTGVGFRVLERDVVSLKPVRQNVKLVNHEYKPLPKAHRNEFTEVDATTDPTEFGSNIAVITIGDSKEGWVESVYQYFRLLTEDCYSHIDEIHVIYNHIRPKGARLNTFGGTASGGESMVVMFEKIHRVLTTDDFAPKPVNGVIRPIHALDIANIIGSLVVVGGVRRTAEIALIDPNNRECLEAKRHIVKGFNDHRYMSNNSVYYEEKPTRAGLRNHFQVMRQNGEPAFLNAQSALLRKPTFKGVNPCCEVLLQARQLCNLVTTNAMAFVKGGKLDLGAFMDAHRANARSAMRMTLVTMELPEWEKVAKADPIVGVSMMGWYDMLDAVGIEADSDEEKSLESLMQEVVVDELEVYCALLGVPVPELATTMKPEGTLSKVAGGVSPGGHRNRAPHFIRRVRVNASDAMCKTVEAQGWRVYNENGQGINDPKTGEYIPVTTKVVEFPLRTTAKITSMDVTAIQQLQSYYNFQKYYTQHNTSITIDVDPDEWEAVEQNIWENWDNFIGVSFMERFSGFYSLMPEEVCSEEEYNTRLAEMADLDIELLNKFELELESAGEDFELVADEACATGACPIR